MTSIAEFMSRDHDRLDLIFAGARKESDGEKAKELFSQFDSGLRAHITWEEEILFPSFEERTGMKDTGPTAVMRIEHLQIKQLLQLVGERIEHGNADEPAQNLLEVLTAHNEKEEQILSIPGWTSHWQKAKGQP